MTQMTQILKQLTEDRQQLNSEPLEFSRLDKTIGTDLMDQLPFLLGALLDEVPVRLSQINCAIKGGAWPEAVRMAHGIKGTSRWFAADALELAALELEEACHVENIAAAMRGARKLKYEATRLRDWLDRYVAHS